MMTLLMMCLVDLVTMIKRVELAVVIIGLKKLCFDGCDVL